MSGFGQRMTIEQVEAHQRRMQGLRTRNVRSGHDVTPIPAPAPSPPPRPPKPSKYRNRKCVVDGESFDSEKEARRWRDLKLMESAGRIVKDSLQRQVRFLLKVGGMEICAYVADFVYRRSDGRRVVEDVKGYKKGMAYRMFKIKASLMFALHKIKVQEI